MIIKPPGVTNLDGAAAAEPLPSVSLLFDRIHERLALQGQLGLLSVTVLQRRGLERSPGWHAYESMVRQISEFLARYRNLRMRREDRLFEPSTSGNAFVLVLEPPRDGRPIDPYDLARVRLRLKRGLRIHLTRCLEPENLDAFGCYVGGTLMRHDGGVKVERIVHRALEEAFADALREKEREGRRHSVHLGRVLERGLVRTVYQPVVDVVARRVVGYEALTRVGTGRFETVEMLFKAAEDNDALWNLERLCRKRALEGLPAIESDQMLFLNVEPDSIEDPQLTDAAFLTNLREAGLDPGQIVLELTEHSVVRDFVAFRRSLHRFRSMGFRLAMDDVGSGYSGLQAITELGPDFIKADMALVRGIHESPIKRELIATIRRFSDTTGITLVAEGVEQPEELEALMQVGVRCAQGYLFARPNSPPSEPNWDVVPRRR